MYHEASKLFVVHLGEEDPLVIDLVGDPRRPLVLLQDCYHVFIFILWQQMHILSKPELKKVKTQSPTLPYLKRSHAGSEPSCM
jgi:hypothetical protein